MKDVNKILLIGRLGADPVMRETKTGYPMATFSLATSRRVRNQSVVPAAESTVMTESPADPDTIGASEPDSSAEATSENAYIDQTEWHRIVVWGREAEQCLQYLKKGNTVFVEGALRQRRFKGKDGADRTLFEIHADLVNFLSGLRNPSADASRIATAV